jgi:hypothetical protein
MVDDHILKDPVDGQPKYAPMDKLKSSKISKKLRRLTTMEDEISTFEGLR